MSVNETTEPSLQSKQSCMIPEMSVVKLSVIFTRSLHAPSIFKQASRYFKNISLCTE